MSQQQQNSVVPFDQKPSKLTKDRNVHPGPKNFFNYCHGLRGPKDFTRNRNLRRLVSRKKAARDLDVSERTITRWTIELEERGWISIEYHGQCGYVITLHGERRRR